MIVTKFSTGEKVFLTGNRPYSILDVYYYLLKNADVSIRIQVASESEATEISNYLKRHGYHTNTVPLLKKVPTERVWVDPLEKNQPKFIFSMSLAIEGGIQLSDFIEVLGALKKDLSYKALSLVGQKLNSYLVK